MTLAKVRFELYKNYLTICYFLIIIFNVILFIIMTVNINMEYDAGTLFGILKYGNIKICTITIVFL